MPRRVPLPALVALASTLLACAGAPPDHAPRASSPPAILATPALAPAQTSCADAAELRARARVLTSEGRLHRIARLLDKADALCPASAPSTWALRVRTLAELGASSDLRALASRIEASPDAPPEARAATAEARRSIEAPPIADPEAARREMHRLTAEGEEAVRAGEHARAKERFLKAWEIFHPHGHALISAGFAARALGDGVGAQRLFDRGVSELEQATGKAMGLDVPNGLGAAAGVAWARDGKLVAVTYGPFVLLLDGATLEERGRLVGHQERVFSVAFSSDGKRVATGSGDQSVRLWDAETGASLFTLGGHKDIVNVVAFSADGKRLVSGSDDGLLGVWDTGSGQSTLSLDLGQSVFSAAFSPDSAQLAVGASDGKIRLYDASTGAPGKTLSGHKGAVFGLAFLPGKPRLVSASVADHAVKIWDLATARAARTIPDFEAGLALSGDGARLAYGAGDKTVRVMDTATGTFQRPLQGHTGNVTSMGFSADGAVLLSCAEDRVALLWDVQKGRTLRAVEHHARPVTALAYSHDGKRLASAAPDGSVFVWNASAKSSFLTLSGHDGAVGALAFSPDDTLLASGGADSTIELWDTALGKAARMLAGHTGPVNAVAFSPDGKRLSSGSDDATVKVFEVATGKEPLTLEKHAGAVNAVAYSPDGKLLASGSADARVKLFDAGTGKRALTLDHGFEYEVTTLGFSPDGQFLETGARQDTLQLWNVQTGANLLTFGGPVGSMGHLAWSPDGKQVVTGSRDANVRIYGATSARYLMPLIGHTEEVTGLTFSPDGRVVASASSDGSILLWDPATGARIATLRAVQGAHAGYVLAAGGHLDFLGDAVDDIAPLCRIGTFGYPYPVCQERFATPGLLARVLAGDRGYLEP